MGAHSPSLCYHCTLLRSSPLFLFTPLFFIHVFSHFLFHLIYSLMLTINPLPYTPLYMRAKILKKKKIPLLKRMMQTPPPPIHHHSLPFLLHVLCTKIF
ncbi:hypothetical protein F4810DRAFT_193902 [Camillea tinctor]|nr:hypothetical protein F4810DRAFT_193902 [Camillea tinctor]